MTTSNRPAGPDAKEALMSASIAIEDIYERLSSIADVLCQASHALPELPPDYDSTRNPVLDWEDRNREPEPSPPEWFAETVIDWLADIDAQAFNLKARFETLPDYDRMPTLSGLIDGFQTEARDHLLGVLYTTRGKPTPRNLANYQRLDREPLTTVVGRRRYATVASDLGDDRRHWLVEITPA